jgi:hypothetical protein
MDLSTQVFKKWLARRHANTGSNTIQIPVTNDADDTPVNQRAGTNWLIDNCSFFRSESVGRRGSSLAGMKVKF